MASELTGRVALVTGAGSGIGRATALAFAAAGAQVVVADLDLQGGQETVDQVTAAGGEASLVGVEVSDDRAVAAMVDHTVDVFGRLDCAFNNAGIEGDSVPLTEATEAEWDRVMAVNAKGVWLCMKHEVPRMIAQGGGAIVNASSVGGVVGLRTGTTYAASKHAVAGLTRAAALDYAPMGIRINATAPAMIDTPLMQRALARIPDAEQLVGAIHPVGRMGRAEEVAATVVWLCSDAASFLTGAIIPVDGGLLAQ